MSEPCTIYSTRVTPFTAAELQSMAGNARVQIEGNPAIWNEATVHWNDCVLQINRMEAGQISSHLRGFEGFIHQCAQSHTPGKMQQGVFAILQCVARVKHVFGTVAEPKITPEARQFLQGLAKSGCSLVFVSMDICNSSFEPLLGPDHPISTTFTIDYWPDSIERKARNDAFLKEQSIPVLAKLPPLPGLEAVSLRDAQSVAHRCISLYATSFYAMPHGITRREARRILLEHSVNPSPKEEAFLKKWFPNKLEKIQFAWRFEALWTLLWALQLFDTLPEPEKPADTNIEELLGNGLKKLLSASLRPKAEIMDVLDRTYRYHWATTDARIKNQPTLPGVDSGVVMERHHALNWLTKFEDAEWDDVQTHT